VIGNSAILVIIKRWGLLDDGNRIKNEGLLQKKLKSYFNDVKNYVFKNKASEAMKYDKAFLLVNLQILIAFNLNQFFPYWRTNEKFKWVLFDKKLKE